MQSVSSNPEFNQIYVPTYVFVTLSPIRNSMLVPSFGLTFCIVLHAHKRLLYITLPFNPSFHSLLGKSFVLYNLKLTFRF